MRLPDCFWPGFYNGRTAEKDWLGIGFITQLAAKATAGDIEHLAPLAEKTSGD